MIDPAEIRFLPARVVPIARATDLGSVQVLKHGNRYLLTDAFGDIHPDSRGLGLYDGDTRQLSCLVLRVGGDRPVLLQASVGGNFRGGIQMTNPSVDRNPDAKVHPMDDLVGRTVGIGRQRVIGVDGMEEQVRVVNHAAREVSLPVVLGLGTDAADIFEVRGYPRRDRGRLLPIAVAEAGRRVTFRYDGLDGIQQLVHLVFTEAPRAIHGPDDDTRTPDGHPDDGAGLHLSWDLHLDPGEERDLSWTIWSSRRPAPGERADTATSRSDVAALFPAAPHVSADEGASAYHAWERGTTTVTSDHELLNLVIKRSVSDLRLLINDGPGPDQRYIAAGVPWFSTLFGRDALITAFQSLAVRPRLAIETLSTLAACHIPRTTARSTRRRCG
jgi:glycogen debranching enzyme